MFERAPAGGIASWCCRSHLSAKRHGKLFHRSLSCFRFSPEEPLAIVRFNRRQLQALRTCPLKRLAFHFSAPLRHAEEILQRRQTRSPAHALGNGDRQIRHLRIFSSTLRSSSCAACRSTASVSLSSSKAKSLRRGAAARVVRSTDPIHRHDRTSASCCARSIASQPFEASEPEYLNVLRRLL